MMLRSLIPALLLTAAVAGAADTNSDWVKPKWLTDVSLGFKLSNDDNVLGVNGSSLPKVSSLIKDVSFKFGLNLAPVVGDGKTIQTLALIYQPDFYRFSDAPHEDYDAHRFATVVKIKVDKLVLSLDNAFLYNDGSKVAPFYALNQFAGAAADQNDKFRNNYAHGLARERRNQIQDRYTASAQYTDGNYFIRPTSSMIYYDLRTRLHNNGVAPYKGYQDYADRWDLNGGVDFGYLVNPNLAWVLGYRYGHQNQQLFAPSITGDRHYSSNNYQRVLIGLEGKVTSWLNVKFAVGPDIRDYNKNTPINHTDTTRLYGEGTVTATIDAKQSLTFGYKQWMFVASTGTAPYVDSTYTLTYKLALTKQFSVDLGVKMLEANYTMGNDVAGSAPSLRDDIDYGASVGLTYTFNPHLSVTANYAQDSGRNDLDSLPITLGPGYRQFRHEVSTLGVQYKF